MPIPLTINERIKKVSVPYTQLILLFTQLQIQDVRVERDHQTGIVSFTFNGSNSNTCTPMCSNLSSFVRTVAKLKKCALLR